MNLKNIFLILGLLVAPYVFTMEIPITTVQKNSLADMLKAELRKTTPNTKRIRDLLDLGAASTFSPEEISDLRRKIEALGKKYLLQQVNERLIMPAIDMNPSREKNEILERIRKRIYGVQANRPASLTGTSSSSSSTSSSTSSSSSSANLPQKRPLPLAPSNTGTISVMTNVVHRSEEAIKRKKLLHYQQLYNALRTFINNKSIDSLQKLLTQASSDPNRIRELFEYRDPNTGQTLFHTAVFSRSRAIFELLLTYIEPLESYNLLLLPDALGFTAIDYAARRLEEGILHALIYYQAPLLFIENSLGRFPVMYILNSNDTGLVMRLVSTLTNNNSTLLHIAIATGNVQIVQQLVSFILANQQLHWLLRHRDDHNVTPYEFALELGNQEIVDILAEAETELEPEAHRTSAASSPEFLAQPTPSTIISEDEQSETNSEHTGTVSNTPAYTSFEELAQALLREGELPYTPSYRTTLSPENLEFSQGQFPSPFPFWSDY